MLHIVGQSVKYSRKGSEQEVIIPTGLASLQQPSDSYI